MNYPIEDIEGIGPAYAEKLGAVNVKNTEDLLEKCRTPKGRETLAEESGLSRKLLLTWANMADLMRVNGVGGQLAELMHGAGVDTIKELRNRNAGNLATKMNEVNEEKKLTKAVVSEAQVQKFIDQAKELEPTITY